MEQMIAKLVFLKRKTNFIPIRAIRIMGGHPSTPKPAREKRDPNHKMEGHVDRGGGVRALEPSESSQGRLNHWVQIHCMRG